MKINLILLSVLLSASSQIAFAGKIYRYLDSSGVSTMSKTLPPYAAQQGYDILDDTSLRLIERVYTREELIKIQEKQRITEQAEQEKQQKLQAEKQKRLEQLANDRNLLARYPNDSVLIRSRDSDLEYRQSQIDDLRFALEKNKQRLVELQTKAGEAELNGEAVSPKLKKQLTSTKSEIKTIKQDIKQATDDKETSAKQYQSDLIRLQELLGTGQKLTD